MRTPAAVLIACCVAAQGLGAVVGEARRPHADRPDDKARKHVETVGKSPHAYRIELGGTVDGTMTRMPIGYSAYAQGWQPNRSVLIENLGPQDVRNPRITVNGKRRWWTLQEIVAEAIRGYAAPADQARAIWEAHRRRRFHACTWDAECSDVLKVLHVYGYTLCGNEAQVMNDLWKAAGFTVRRGHPVGHCVTEVYYDGAYHLLDSDEHVICLNRDNRTIASCEEIVRDHDLVKRTHTYGIGAREDRKTDEFSASLYSYEGPRSGDWGTNTRHSMDLTLRPGESIEFRWDHVGKQYTAGQPPKKGQRMVDGLGDLLAGWGQVAYDNMRNGKLRYRPDLAGPAATRGAQRVANARFDAKSGSIRPVDAAKPAEVTWAFASPYVFVGGKAAATVTLAAKASAQWRYSADGKSWRTLASLAEPGRHAMAATLDEAVSPRGRPTYRFQLQLALAGEAAAEGVAFDNDIQTSLLALPELEVGTNDVVYTDADPDSRNVRIAHEWMERTAWHPPAAPPAAMSPQDGATVPGSRVAFQWKGSPPSRRAGIAAGGPKPPADPDGDGIVDYHFELSEHADMRWPLSPNFEKLTSLTPSKGQPRWTVPYDGLLNPDTWYYWRVRARGSGGVWGPWSRTFRFRVAAPGVPLDVRLAVDDSGGLVLHWRPNASGRPAAAYKVYGSDERGFSVSDAEHLVFRGKGFVRTVEEYAAKAPDAPDAGLVKTPGNLIARVEGTSLRVVGSDLAAANTNRAYYRVAAIDLPAGRQAPPGSQSGPSDYAEVPRPFVLPPTPRERQVRLGQPYRYRPRTIRSLGDLRCRPSKASSYNAAFWDREELTFAATGLPEGLALDAATGEISGTPTKAGESQVTLKASDQFGKSRSASFSINVASGQAQTRP